MLARRPLNTARLNITMDALAKLISTSRSIVMASEYCCAPPAAAVVAAIVMCETHTVCCAISQLWESAPGLRSTDVYRHSSTGIARARLCLVNPHPWAPRIHPRPSRPARTTPTYPTPTAPSHPMHICCFGGTNIQYPTPMHVAMM